MTEPHKLIVPFHKVRNYLSMLYNAPKTIDTFKRMITNTFPEIGIISITESVVDDGIEILYTNERENFESDLNFALIGRYVKQENK